MKLRPGHERPVLLAGVRANARTGPERTARSSPRSPDESAAQRRSTTAKLVNPQVPQGRRHCRHRAARTSSWSIRRPSASLHPGYWRAEPYPRQWGRRLWRCLTICPTLVNRRPFCRERALQETRSLHGESSGIVPRIGPASTCRHVSLHRRFTVAASTPTRSSFRFAARSKLPRYRWRRCDRKYTSRHACRGRTHGR